MSAPKIDDDKRFLFQKKLVVTFVPGGDEQKIIEKGLYDKMSGF